MIKSTNEFIDLTKSIDTTNCYLASLDVENLFTNVPVQETINIILDNVFNHPTLPPLAMEKQTLEDLLITCTTETPFKNINGDIYKQQDGISMGGPLGPLFANYYMCHLENNILPQMDNPPVTYTRYVDDIFLVIKNISTLNEMKDKFENFSVLNFTFEIETKKSLTFLDVKSTRNSNSNSLQTSVHVKTTHSGDCINYNSVAPERYKTGIIKTFLHRAYKICSDWNSFSTELDRIKQLLTNNNFPMAIIDQHIETFLNNKFKTNNNSNETTPNTNLNIYFRNQMSIQYKQEEEMIKSAVTEYVKPKQPNTELKFHIYYKATKLKNLLIKNNVHRTVTSNVVYRYTCNNRECELSETYIGYTECDLIDRLRNHSQNGAILIHNMEKHNLKITTSEIRTATKVMKHFNRKDELLIAEALLIKQENPSLNRQHEGDTRVLSIF